MITEELLLKEIENVMNASGKKSIIIAIDGRCAAGKTTFAGKLAAKCAADLAKDAVNVIHMDDFFLRPEQRTKERLLEPGGNVDRERFLEEILYPLSERKAFSYRPFDCQIQGMKQPIFVEPGAITIIEGAYACHPQLREFYDLTVFMDIDPAEQMRRIRKRNGEEGAQRFQTRWIPLEEKYFKAFQVKNRCDICGEIEKVNK